MKINCIIIDDEPIAREGLKNYINDFDDIELIGTFKDAIDASNSIYSKDKIDLIFLDINMPKLNGIEFLKKVQPKQLIVITTAYSQFAIESYELNVLDYLLKPISFDRFNKCIMKVRDYIQYSTIQNEGKRKYIFIKNGNLLQKIFSSEILFIEASSNYYKIVTDNNQYLQYGSLYKIQEELDTEIFIKVHRSYLINKSRIDSFNNKQIFIQKFSIPISNSFEISKLKK